MTRQTDQNQTTAVPATSGRVLYSVIRYVPSVLREEFVNVGVIVVSPGQNGYGLKIVSSFGDESRVKLLPNADGMFVRHAMSVLTSTLGDVTEWTEQQFRDLRVPYAANNIQLTPPRPAVTANLDAFVDTLFTQLVENVKPQRVSARAGRRVIREEVRSVFAQQGLFKLGLQENYQLPVRSEPVVDLAYKNGIWHCYQAIAFDVDRRMASQQVNALRQAVTDARRSNVPELAQGHFAIFTNEKGDKNLKDDLVGLLGEQGVKELSVDDAPAEAMRIQTDLRAHDLVHQA